MAGGTGENHTEEVDLNITPIIDAFVVLITFLLISASFVSIGILDAGISAAGAASSNVTPPPIRIQVELQDNQTFQLNVSGKAEQKLTIRPVKPGEWNYEALTAQLTQLKSKWPDVTALTLSAGNKIEYKDVVKAMEVSRKQHPNVLLGGF